MSGQMSITYPGFESPLASVKAFVDSKIEAKEVLGSGSSAGNVTLIAGFT